MSIDLSIIAHNFEDIHGAAGYRAAGRALDGPSKSCDVATACRAGRDDNRRHDARSARPARRFCAAPPSGCAVHACWVPSGGLDLAAAPVPAQSAARSRRRPRARQGMAARLLEASAAAVVDRRPRLSAHRPASIRSTCSDRSRSLSASIAVWLLARDIAGAAPSADRRRSRSRACTIYNFSAVKFAHDQMQLPFWALTGLFFYRAIVRGRTLDWLLAGAVPGTARSGRNMRPSCWRRRLA